MTSPANRRPARQFPEFAERVLQMAGIVQRNLDIFAQELLSKDTALTAQERGRMLMTVLATVLATGIMGTGVVTKTPAGHGRTGAVGRRRTRHKAVALRRFRTMR